MNLRAGGGGDVEIAGGVDHHVAEDRLAAGLGLADHAADAAVLHDRAARTRSAAARSTPASAIISFETRFQPSGSNAAAKTIGCGFICARKSKAPQRAHLS